MNDCLRKKNIDIKTIVELGGRKLKLYFSTTNVCLHNLMPNATSRNVYDLLAPIIFDAI